MLATKQGVAQADGNRAEAVAEPGNPAGDRRRGVGVVPEHDGRFHHALERPGRDRETRGVERVEHVSGARPMQQALG